MLTNRRLYPAITLLLAATAATGTVEAASPAPSQGMTALGFRATGRLHDPRIHPGVVLLADGRVLVLGGYDVATAERWDPATGAWELVGTMRTPREDPVVRLLPNGRVLVTGGHDGETTPATAEVWDPVTRSFSILDGPPPTPGPDQTAGQESVGAGDAISHGFIRLADGRELTVGGWRKGECQKSLCAMHPSAEASIFDPATGARESVGPLPEPRTESVLVRLADGRILVIGGHCHCDVDGTALLFGPV